MTHPRENQIWTDSEENILIRYFRSGEDISLLSERHLRSAEKIEIKLVELGWLSPPPTEEPFDELEQRYLAELSSEHEHDCRDEPYDEICDTEPQEDFGEWIANMRLNLSGQKASLVRDKDWGEAFDDFESDDWEDYLGGPDDELFGET